MGMSYAVHIRSIETYYGLPISRIQYVGAAFVASVWVISWQIGLVAKSRRKAKIAYPQSKSL